MRRIATALGVSLLIAAFAAGTALAANAHYIYGPTVTIAGNSLTVSGKAAGLGNTVSSVDVALTGTADVNSRCYTKSNNQPQAANKQETISVDSTGTFPVRNGSVTFSLSVSPVSTLTCPKGQHVVIESISYDLFLDWPMDSLDMEITG